MDYGDNEIIAVCNDENQYCDDISLLPNDIIIHELDRRKLADMVAQALGIQPAFTPLEGFYQTFMVGEIQQFGSRRFPVFLTIQLNKGAMRDVTIRLLTKADTPILLLGGTKNMVDLEMTDLLARHKSRFVPLEDLLIQDDLGKRLTEVISARVLLYDFLELATPDQTPENTSEYFPTPPGAKWEHFIFEFLADSVLNVRCKGVKQPQRLEPEHLGMKRKDNGKPTLQWVLLMALAVERGHLSWESQHANPKVKAQKQALSKKLRRYFLLDEEPIPWKRNPDAFETRFVLRHYISSNYDWLKNEWKNLEE
ncbi:MAG: hypothetical protein H8E42_00180 [Nitrospinae bacterium]|nr:hypothetical protein [Nitrospinota bacterium]